MTARCIEPAKRPLDAEFRAVPSKSATHRALVGAAMAAGRSTIAGPLVAEDTQRTLYGLRTLGVRIEEDGGLWHVDGVAGSPRGGGIVHLGASGTSARFLTAFAALGSAPSLLDGTARLRERPMSELVDALRALGASVDAPGGTLPVRAGGAPVPGGSVAVRGDQSSQFTSALLLAACGFRDGLRLQITGPRVSWSYVEMTLEMLATFGAVVERSHAGGFIVPPQTLHAAEVTVEGDHSSASYHLAAVAILGGRLRARGLRCDSLQPDARFLEDLTSLGCRIEHDGDDVVVTASGELPGFTWDLAGAPDLAPTAAVLALFASGPSRLSGLDHLRLKESDRLAVIAVNVEKLGAFAKVNGGTLTIEPPPRGALHGAVIDAAGDHRIAMAFALAGRALSGVSIDGPEAVAKSYPGYWQDAAAIFRTGS
jgi:3-phosphoshikimate 1-carboxyvinyltransferase